VDENERHRILETLISRFNLAVLNMGDHIRSCLGLSIHSPVISLHLTWTLVYDNESGHFSVSLSFQSATFQEEHNPDWLLKHSGACSHNFLRLRYIF
jgi:hypothetical protein